MKNLKRVSVLGGIILGLVFMGTVEAQAQGVPTRLSEVQAKIDRALHTLGQLESTLGRFSQLEAALAAEKAARIAADLALQDAINGIKGGVTQAALDAAIASEVAARQAADTAEANARATADAALEGQIANEVGAREALADTVAALGESVAPLASLAPLAPLATYVRVETATINGLAGPHVIVEGANLHIRSGVPDSLVANGRGNLIVGYNEESGAVPAERGGSHNVVIGVGHRYDFGTGLVAGYVNRLGSMAASITGGGFNEALEFAASVTGGSNNKAIGMFSSVTAGDRNAATGDNAAVNGGSGNNAAGSLSAVSGGLNKTASTSYSVVP